MLGRVAFPGPSLIGVVVERSLFGVDVLEAVVVHAASTTANSGVSNPARARGRRPWCSKRSGGGVVWMSRGFIGAEG